MLVQASLKAMPNSYESLAKNYELVDEALRIIKNSGLKYEIGCSETTVEGENTDILNLIAQIQQYYYEKDIQFLIFATIEYNKEQFYIENKKENIAKI